MAARNIMVSNDLEIVKIIDFGQSRSDQLSHRKLVPNQTLAAVRWSAPEVFLSDANESQHKTFSEQKRRFQQVPNATLTIDCFFVNDY